MDDGIALVSVAHPRPPWYKRPWFWVQRLFGYPRLNPASLETIEIEIENARRQLLDCALYASDPRGLRVPPKVQQ